MSVEFRSAPVHPALAAHAEQRARDAQNRIADAITRFAGSMWFVYVHSVWFAAWIGFGVESFPFGLLTMVVSLEAIFLAAFLLISQNRADALRHALADEEYGLAQKEEARGEELVQLSRRILALTEDVHRLTAERRP